MSGFLSREEMLAVIGPPHIDVVVRGDQAEPSRRERDPDHNVGDQHRLAEAHRGTPTNAAITKRPVEDDLRS